MHDKEMSICGQLQDCTYPKKRGYITQTTESDANCTVNEKQKKTIRIERCLWSTENAKFPS